MFTRNYDNDFSWESFHIDSLGQSEVDGILTEHLSLENESRENLEVWIDDH